MSKSKYDTGTVSANVAQAVADTHDLDYAIVLHRTGDRYGYATHGKTQDLSGAAALIASALLEVLTTSPQPENFDKACQVFGDKIKAEAQKHG